jgi:hypothetical protein
MTNRFKDFGAGGSVNTTPLSFKIHGEEFHCRPSIQGKTLLDIVANSGSGDDSGVGAAKTINTFFEVTLVEESYKRFEALLTNPDKIVSVETLGEITAWLVEEYSSRPTPQPEPSLSGQ